MNENGRQVDLIYASLLNTVSNFRGIRAPWWHAKDRTTMFKSEKWFEHEVTIVDVIHCPWCQRNCIVGIKAYESSLYAQRDLFCGYHLIMDSFTSNFGSKSNTLMNKEQINPRVSNWQSPFECRKFITI